MVFGLNKNNLQSDRPSCLPASARSQPGRQPGLLGPYNLNGQTTKGLYPSTVSEVPELRRKLRDGFVVVKISGRHAKYEDCITGRSYADTWWHIGHQSLSPFSPFFMLVEPTADLREFEHDGTYQHQFIFVSV